MRLFYSAHHKGFFDDQWHPTLPADAVEISAETHRELLQAEGMGLQIVADANGYPIAAPPPAPSHEQLLEGLRAERDARLASSDYLMMPDYPISEAQRQAWADYRQQLRDLPENITDPANVDWPEPPTGEPA